MKKLILLAIITLSTNIANAQWQQTGLSSGVILSLASDGTNIFAGDQVNVYLSTNSGGLWTAANTGVTTGIFFFSLAISDTNIFAGSFNAGVFLFTNNGTNWTAVNTGLTNLKVYSLAISGINIFAGTDGGGVFLSTNNGANWTAVNTGFPANTNVYPLVISGTNIFAGSTQGVWKRPLSEMVAVIEENNGDVSFMLYPNPTSGKFTIEWDGGQGTSGELEIYNVLGEKMYSSTIWHPISNIDISSQPRGIYFYQVISKEKSVSSGKLIIQ